jgi:hypothetical protein
MVYLYLVLNLVLISWSRDNQKECKRAIESYVKESTLKREFFQQDVLRKWTQSAIDVFYQYCFIRHVIPEMDTNRNYLSLSGSKDSVKEAENEYYREQIRQSERARLTMAAQDIVWAYEVDENEWEKYSRELNARIEDAYSSGVSKVSFNMFTYLMIFYFVCGSLIISTTGARKKPSIFKSCSKQVSTTREAGKYFGTVPLICPQTGKSNRAQLYRSQSKPIRSNTRRFLLCLTKHGV